MKLDPTYCSPFIDLGPDIFRLILSHLCGESLDDSISTTAYRILLPFAVCCKHHYIHTTELIRGLSLLPFPSYERPARRSIPPFPLALRSWNPPSSTPAITARPCADVSSVAIQNRQPVTTPRHALNNANIVKLSRHLPQAIAHLPSLRTLNLYRNSEVDDPALFKITQACPQLRELRLRACAMITPNGLKGLPHCDLLTVLDLSCCINFGDESASVILKLRRLSYLSVAYWPISDAFIQTISGNSSIRELCITGCTSLTSRSCRTLASWNGLRKLDFQSCRTLDDNAVCELQASSSLESLDLTLTQQLSNCSLRAISHMDNLQVLNVSHCTLLTDEGVGQLLHLRALKRIDLSFCHLLTDRALVALSRLLFIEEILLAGCGCISDVGVESLARVPWLHTVVLLQCVGLTDRSAYALRDSGNSSPWRVVDLRKCSAVSDKALLDLQPTCLQLLRSFDD